MRPAIKSEKSPPICSRIDESHFPQLIEKVKSVLQETGSHKAQVFGARFWTWQYRDLPTHETRIYGIMADNEILGYYHVPIYQGLIRGERKHFAVVQEVAVSRRLRGQGLFRRLADFATGDLLQSGIQAAYTFPNEKSIHTFLKYNGYTRISTFQTFLLPVRSGAILGSKVNLGGIEKLAGFFGDLLFGCISVREDIKAEVRLHKEIDKDILGVFSAYQKEHTIALLRDEIFLKWRFEGRPSSTYQYFAIHKGGRVLAAAIFKLDEMFQNPVLLLMDFAYLSKKEKYLLQLIQHVKRHGGKEIGEDFNLILASGNSKVLPRLKRIGFLPLLKVFNRRPLNLLVRNLAGNSEDIFSPENWHLTLTDWDVF